MESKVRLILMVIHGVIGMSAGICGCAVFASKYGNTSAAVWAGISAFVALLYVQANRSVYRDVNRVISPQCFVIYIFIAGIFVLAGSVVMITYLSIGLIRKEGRPTNVNNFHWFFPRKCIKYLSCLILVAS